MGSSSSRWHCPCCRIRPPAARAARPPSPPTIRERCATNFKVVRMMRHGPRWACDTRRRGRGGWHRLRLPRLVQRFGSSKATGDKQDRCRLTHAPHPPQRHNRVLAANVLVALRIGSRESPRPDTLLALALERGRGRRREVAVAPVPGHLFALSAGER